MFEEPTQTFSFPLMVPGAAGMLFTVILSVRGAEEPQELFAVTVILPLVELAVVTMEFVVEVPVHPTGNVQV